MKNLLSIAGTDPTGGAGIQTDLKTFEAHGEYGMAVIAAVVAQNTFHVTGMQAMPAELVGKQIECVFEDIRPDAVKIGMLYDAEIIHEVAERLRAHHAKNIVLDPVMMSSSGQTLLRRDAAETLIRELFPLCTLITPLSAVTKSQTETAWSRRHAKSPKKQAARCLSRAAIWRTARTICCSTGRSATGSPLRASITPTRTAPAARCPRRLPATSQRGIRSR